MWEQSRLVTYTRSGDGNLEEPYEKAVVVPAENERDVALYAWADARFATDILAEHALFFALLMPLEVAASEREEALRFRETSRASTGGWTSPRPATGSSTPSSPP